MSLPDLAWLTSTPPREVTVLSGAGVSTEGPSSLPTGRELTERVFDAYLPPGSLDVVLSRHREVGWNKTSSCPLDRSSTEPRLPRLETVFGVVAGVYGDRAVDDSVVDVVHAAPNRVHHFLARHLAEGGAHVTANFDECVEKAGAALGIPQARCRVQHFHGSTGPSGDVLGATLDRVQRGFSPGLAHEFLSALSARPVVLVLGYSGSDFFDVDVAVRSLAADALAGTRVLWALHSDHPPHFVTDDAGLPPLVAALRNAGARVDALCCSTQWLLALLGNAWAFPPLGDAQARVPQTPVIAVDGDLRAVCALALFLEMGMFDQVRRIIPRPPPRASEELVRTATSATLWELGRWNDLRRYWIRVVPTTDQVRVQRLERIGATLWVQGRLLPAYLWLTWHRRRATGEAEQLLAETEGRVLEHMLRTPDLAWFARSATRRHLRVLVDPGQAAGIHPYRTRSDLKSSLEQVVSGTTRDGHASTSSEWFNQAGNLLAWVTYRHRMLRDTYDEQLPDAQLRDAYWKLRHQYEVVGSLSGAMRTVLLPGAERVFTAREVYSSLSRLQHGWWHRVRIIGRHFVSRHRANRRR